MALVRQLTVSEVSYTKFKDAVPASSDRVKTGSYTWIGHVDVNIGALASNLI